MAGDDGGRMDESTTPDLGHERRVIAAIVVAVVALAVLGAVVLRAKPEAPADVVGLTAYAKVSDTRLAVQYLAAEKQSVVGIDVEETGSTVTITVRLVPLSADGGPAIAPVTPAGREADLKQPLGDRRVVDAYGTVVPELPLDQVAHQP